MVCMPSLMLSAARHSHIATTMTKQLTATGVAKMRPGKERLEIRGATSGLLLVIQRTAREVGLVLLTGQGINQC